MGFSQYAKAGVRTVLTWLGLTVVAIPLLTIVVGVLSSLVLLPLLAPIFGAALIAIPATVLFLRRSYSLRRLGMFVGVYLILFQVMGLLYATFVQVVLFPDPTSRGIGVVNESSPTLQAIIMGLLILVVVVPYVIPYALVYRGGYDRLMTWLDV